VGPLERKTFEAVAQLFLDDKRANSRRFSTLEEYETELKLRLLPQATDELPPPGPRNIRNIRRRGMKAHFNALRNNGCTVSQVNKAIKTAKAIFTYAFDSEYTIERGRRSDGDNQRDIRKTIESAPSGPPKDVTSA